MRQPRRVSASALLGLGRKLDGDGDGIAALYPMDEHNFVKKITKSLHCSHLVSRWSTLHSAVAAILPASTIAVLLFGVSSS
jgi:hypothetical protein